LANFKNNMLGTGRDLAF